MFSTEQLTQRWEDQRAIKNLMGKYANCILLNREKDVFGMFWSGREDLCLSFNDGVYVGYAAVMSYYAACDARNKLVASLLQKRFPKELGGKSEDEIEGIGPFKIKPMYCPVIEIAEDGKTAKGLWYCQGSYNEVDSRGPMAYWNWGYFAADFVRENGEWKLWHLSCTNDVECVCGQSWGKEQTLPEELPEFAELKGFALPAFTVRKQLRSLYTPNRPHADSPRIPEPYESFANTFSYAV